MASKGYFLLMVLWCHMESFLIVRNFFQNIVLTFNQKDDPLHKERHIEDFWNLHGQARNKAKQIF